jgi:hypothetical protein
MLFRGGVRVKKFSSLTLSENQSKTGNPGGHRVLQARLAMGACRKKL